MVKGGTPHTGRYPASLCAQDVFLSLMCLLSSGCAVIPEITHEPQVHNPFPQLQRVAILPFYNLSTDPTVNQDDVALAYYNELQQIPGFEVMPPSVVKQWLVANRIEVDGTTDFQLLARKLGVDAVIRGAVTEFTPYYPPRMGIAVDWFAANPSFYAIPPGYGLPGARRKRSTFPIRWCLRRSSLWRANSSRRRPRRCPRIRQRIRRHPPSFPLSTPQAEPLPPPEVAQRRAGPGVVDDRRPGASPRLAGSPRIHSITPLRGSPPVPSAVRAGHDAHASLLRG